MKQGSEVGKKQLREEIRRWAAKIGVKPRAVRIQHMTRKWASCSSSGTVCFSNALLSEAASFREVVIVHELLHLMVPNHGKLFKSLLKSYLPGWDKHVGREGKPLCGNSLAEST